MQAHWFRLALKSSLVTMLVITSLAALASAEDRKAYRIGAIAPLTGAGAGWGKKAQEGWQLAVKELNRSATRSRFDLLVEDSKTSGAGAVSAFHKLVSEDKVDVVVGDVWDFLTTPLVPLADRAKKVLVSTIIPQSTTQTSPYFFTLGPKTESVKGAVEKFFDLNPQVNTIAILGWDNDWGYGYDAIWKDVAQARGKKIIAEIRTADLGSDWRVEVSRIAKQKPDAVFFHYQADRILRRLNEVGLSPKLLTTSNVTEELFAGLLPEKLLDSLYFTDWPPTSDFIARFEQEFGELPILNASDAYEAIRSIAAAISNNATDLQQGMSQVSYDGVTGPVDFRKSRHGNYSAANLYKIKDGKRVLATERPN